MDMELDNNIQYGLKETLGQILGLKETLGQILGLKETLGQILGLDETLGQILGLDIELDNVCLHSGPDVGRNMDMRLEVHH